MKAMRISTTSSLPEKIIYGLGDVGANLCWTFMASFVTLYYTDSAGIAAAAAGSFMLIARILDGITDVLCAFLMQKVNTRWGKIRPWFWIAAPLLGIGVYISFNIPMGLSDSQKLMWAFLTYTFTGAVAFTIYNLAFTAILPLMSLDQDDRNKASSMQRVICGAGILVIMNVTPILLGMFGGIKEKQLPAAGESAETAEISAQPETVKEEKVPVLTVLKKAVCNKYMPLLLIFFIAYYWGSTVYSGVLSYYCRDIMGNMNFVGILSFGKTLPMMFVIPFCPVLFKKFGKRKVVMITLLGAGVCSLLKMLNPDSMSWVLLLCILGSICNGPVSAAMFTYVADLVDYVREKKNVQSESFIAMTSSVGTKLGSGVGSAFVGWMLSLGGYNAELAQQGADALFSMNLMANAVPAVSAVIIVICLLFWDMDKKKAH